MATQKMQSQESILQEAHPRTLYELLIYDNKKLSSKKDGPHIIMRRSLKGKSQEDLATPLEAEETGPPSQEQINNNEEAGQGQFQIEEKEDLGFKNDSVGADTISNYIASLSCHVQSDVLRVVDAIIELENQPQSGEEDCIQDSEEDARELPDKINQDSDSLEVYLEEEAETNFLEENTEGINQIGETDFLDETAKKKGVDISEIFRSLKNARKKAQQKSYSYKKTVEYEDR